MTIRVNGEPIPEAAVQYELDRLITFYSGHMSADKIRDQMDALRKRAAQQAVGTKLLVAESRKMEFEVPAIDVDASLKTMVENAGGEEAFARLLQSQNLTLEQIRFSIRQGRKVDMLVAKVTEGAPDPTEEEIRAHYDEHAAEYRLPDRAAAQHILVKPAYDTEADRATARAKITEIRARIVDGADFADEAAAHSECPSGTQTGGSLGWFSRGMMVPEFDDVVFAMAVGELSEVVQTPLGLHLVCKTGEEEGGQAEFEDVREKIRDFLRHVRRGEMIAAYVDELKKNVVIDES